MGIGKAVVISSIKGKTLEVLVRIWEYEISMSPLITVFFSMMLLTLHGVTSDRRHV